LVIRLAAGGRKPPLAVTRESALKPEVFNKTGRENQTLRLTAEFNTMKAVNKLAVLLSLGALASFAYADADGQTYIETCRKEPGVPVPVAVVTPSVGPEYDGAIVQLEFVVEATGKPANFSVKSTTDNMLAAAVMDAVKQWRFKPAEADGKPVATKVLLPIRIVDAIRAQDRVAAN
jgi:protein TonB